MRKRKSKYRIPNHPPPGCRRLTGKYGIHTNFRALAGLKTVDIKFQWIIYQYRNVFEIHYPGFFPQILKTLKAFKPPKTEEPRASQPPSADLPPYSVLRHFTTDDRGLNFTTDRRALAGRF